MQTDDVLSRQAVFVRCCLDARRRRRLPIIAWKIDSYRRPSLIPPCNFFKKYVRFIDTYGSIWYNYDI